MVLASSFLLILSTTCSYNHFSPNPSNTTVLGLISHTLIPVDLNKAVTIYTTRIDEPNVRAGHAVG